MKANKSCEMDSNILLPFVVKVECVLRFLIRLGMWSVQRKIQAIGKNPYDSLGQKD